MKKSIKTCKPAVSLLIMLLFTYSLLAQSIDLSRDAIDSGKAKDARNEFKKGLKNSNKGTNYVTFNTDQLKEIVDKCDALGIDTIQFLICSFREADINQYVDQYEKKHRAKKNLRGLSRADNRDLIGRPYLVIKIPRRVFDPGGASGKSALPGAMTSLLASGLLPVNPEGSQEGFLYLSIGRICPPPVDCAD